jgi:hypothetical protein
VYRLPVMCMLCLLMQCLLMQCCVAWGNWAGCKLWLHAAHAHTVAWLHAPVHKLQLSAWPVALAHLGICTKHILLLARVLVCAAAAFSNAKNIADAGEWRARSAVRPHPAMSVVLLHAQNNAELLLHYAETK